MGKSLSGRTPARIEWPTIAVAVAIYGGFGLLTWWYHALPWWLVVPLAAYLLAWHGALQHEVVHGHPTPWPRVNEGLVFPILWLWMPFRVYRETHLAHHNDAALTDPVEDPESFYVTPQDWARLGLLSRAYLWILNTLAGRMVLGPFLSFWRLGRAEIGLVLAGDRRHLGIWAWHALSCALVLGWVVGVCDIPALEYLAFFAYPGASFNLVRSFLEHQARPEVRERTAIVESGPVMSLMFLNNNLHMVHHLEPGTAWYRLPARYWQNREAILEHNGGYLLPGYGWIALRYLFWPKESPVHRLS